MEDEEREKYLPERVIGDLDSVKAEVRQFYESKGVIFDLLPDQDYNDFEKSLNYILQASGDNSPHRIVAYGALGGRMD